MKVDHREMGEALAAEVVAASAVDRVCAAADGRRAIRAARQALPAMASSACRWDVRLALYRFMRHAHEAGLEVQVWTVDDEADMKRLLGWGADALISNRPDLAVRVRNEFMSGGQSLSALQR
jgi:glycerophosphoryl diester phosphodiesterase